MKTFNNSDFDAMFDKVDNNFNNTAKRAKNGIMAIWSIVLLVALALTVAGVVLALTVSGWFWISVILTGGYSLIAAVVMGLAHSIYKSVE